MVKAKINRWLENAVFDLNAYPMTTLALFAAAGKKA